MLPSYTADPELSRVKLIASDMDLTLLSDDKVMPDGMPERIASLDAAGITFCAASGRPAGTLLEAFPGCRSKMAVIADNGGYVECRGEVVYRDLVDPALYHELLARATKLGGCVPVLCCFDKAFVLERDRAHHEQLSIYYLDIVYVDSFDSVSPESDKTSLLFPNWDSEEAFDAIYGSEFGDRLNVTCAGKEWMDFMNLGVNKGSGLARLCDHVGATLGEAAALGDTYNDIQMLKAAGHSCIVANAEDHMEAYARYRIPSNNEGGVPIYIDAVLETFS